MKDIPYANVVGSIMYSMVSTRPDLAYGMSVLSRFIVDPGKTHWLALKGMLKYLRISVELQGLLYKRGKTDYLIKVMLTVIMLDVLILENLYQDTFSLYMVEP